LVSCVNGSNESVEAQKVLDAALKRFTRAEEELMQLDEDYHRADAQAYRV
jgi:hypothetical protein